MAKQNILIVDADPESVKVLEVSLKKAGYSVTKSPDGQDALEMIGFSAPDLIISDTKMPHLDGFELCTKLKENEETEQIPFIFLTADKSIENKVRGLELGVEDYLNKPIFIREILVRVNLALQRREKERLENRAGGAKSKFSGSLQDMGVVDLLQTIELGHKSGVIHLDKADDNGEIYFREGQVIDAKTDTRKGADAIYRMLVWSEGTFEIEFKAIDHEQTIELSTQGLLMEGMRQLDEWGRLQEQLPPLTSVFDVDEDVLAERLGEIPDEVNTILKHFDGQAPLMDVVNRAGLGDLEALTVISKLYFEGLILEVPPRPTIPAPAETEAILSDEALTSSTLPKAAVPSRIIDDAIGPHLSVAADPLGFVRALTQSAPPAAPLANEEETKPRLQLETADEPKKAAVPVARIIPKKVAVPAHDKEVRDKARTMVGFAAPELSKLADEMVSTSVSSDERATRTMGSKELPHKDDIAAAIDAEIPPPEVDDEEVSEDSISKETSGYFEGDAYKKSFDTRPSYEPPPTEASSRDADSDGPSPDSARPDDKYDEDDEDDEDDGWGDEHEDEPTVPGNAKPLIAILVLVLVGALIGGIWFLQQDTDEPVVDKKTDKNETPKTLTGGDAVKTAAPLDKAPEPDIPASSETAAAPKDDENAPSASPEAAPSASETASAASPEATAGDEQPAAAEEPSAPAEPGAPLSPEQRAMVNKLVNDAKRGAKKRKVKLLEQAIAIDPNNDTALSMLAIELLERKQTRDEAYRLAQKATAINSDNAVGWMAIGYIHQLNGNGDGAKEAYRKCADCSGPKDYVRECKRLR